MIDVDVGFSAWCASSKMEDRRLFILFRFEEIRYGEKCFEYPYRPGVGIITTFLLQSPLLGISSKEASSPVKQSPGKQTGSYKCSEC